MLQDTLALATQLDLESAASMCETSLAWLLLADGEVDRALEHAMSSFRRWSRHRNPLFLGTTRVALAVVHLHLDEPDAARELLEEAQRDLATHARHHALARQLLALVHFLEGDPHAARAALERALPLAPDNALVHAAHVAFQGAIQGDRLGLEELPSPYREALRPLLRGPRSPPTPRRPRDRRRWPTVE